MNIRRRAIRRAAWLPALVLLMLAAFVSAPPARADDGLVTTTWGTAEDPGPPFYARIEYDQPRVINDGEWAAVAFYRDPGCIPAQFNLLHFMDVPAAFGCGLVTEGTSTWEEPLVGAPRMVTARGTAVPVWFVPVVTLDTAAADGVLTIGELAGLDGLVKGTATTFKEVLHPTPLPPSVGGGGHPQPKMVQVAHGQLADGREFHLNAVKRQGSLVSVGLRFR